MKINYWRIWRYRVRDNWTFSMDILPSSLIFNCNGSFYNAIMKVINFSLVAWKLNVNEIYVKTVWIKNKGNFSHLLCVTLIYILIFKGKKNWKLKLDKNFNQFLDVIRLISFYRRCLDKCIQNCIKFHLKKNKIDFRIFFTYLINKKICTIWYPSFN